VLAYGRAGKAFNIPTTPGYRARDWNLNPLRSIYFWLPRLFGKNVMRSGARRRRSCRGPGGPVRRHSFTESSRVLLGTSPSYAWADSLHAWTAGSYAGFTPDAHGNVVEQRSSRTGWRARWNEDPRHDQKIGSHLGDFRSRSGSRRRRACVRQLPLSTVTIGFDIKKNRALAKSGAGTSTVASACRPMTVSGRFCFHSS
jgi:hypothetical protein